MTTPQTLFLTKTVTTAIIWLLKPPALTQVEAGVFYL